MVARARIERGKRPGDWEVPFSAPIDLRGTSRPSDPGRIDVPESGDPLGAFVTERQPSDTPSALQEPPIVEQPAWANQAPAWANQAIDAPPLPERHDPVILQAPVPSPHRRRRRPVLALVALFAAAFLGAYLYESNRALEWYDTPASAPSTATEVEIVAPKTEPRPSADVNDEALSAASQDSAVIRSPGPSQNRSAEENPTTSSPNIPAEPSSAASTAPSGNVATSGTLPNVAGSWALTTRVESSSYPRYAGLQLGYEIRLDQKGDHVTGSGKKITENGSEISPRGQTPLTISGTISGDRLTLNFVERGTRRSTQGKFVLILDEAGRLRGRFSSSAAQSSGLVEADRVPTP